MNSTKFYAGAMERWHKVSATLGLKSQEYATDKDALYNFKRAARLRNGLKGESLAGAAEALKGMLIKHWVSIEDMVAIWEATGRIDPKRVDEKLGDAIAYLFVLDGLFHEEEHPMLVCDEEPDLQVAEPRPG